MAVVSENAARRIRTDRAEAAEAHATRKRRAGRIHRRRRQRHTFGRHVDHMGLKIAREVAVFMFYLALAIALTWPMAMQIDRVAIDIGDPLLHTFILDRDLYSFTHASLDLYAAPMLYPGKFPLAYSDN